MTAWHSYRRDDPQGDKAQADNELMMALGSQALLIRVSRLQAEREGPDAVLRWRRLRGIGA